MLAMYVAAVIGLYPRSALNLRRNNQRLQYIKSGERLFGEASRPRLPCLLLVGIPVGASCRECVFSWTTHRLAASQFIGPLMLDVNKSINLYRTHPTNHLISRVL